LPEEVYQEIKARKLKVSQLAQFGLALIKDRENSLQDLEILLNQRANKIEENVTERIEKIEKDVEEFIYRYGNIVQKCNQGFVFLSEDMEKVKKKVEELENINSKVFEIDKAKEQLAHVIKKVDSLEESLNQLKEKINSIESEIKLLGLKIKGKEYGILIKKSRIKLIHFCCKKIDFNSLLVIKQ
jgi:vacuolar-type H+-ATPase subunit I/STV1